MVLKKSELRLARKIWTTQKNHPKTRFVAKDFTATGKLTKQGLTKVRK